MVFGFVKSSVLTQSAFGDDIKSEGITLGNSASVSESGIAAGHDDLKPMVAGGGGTTNLNHLQLMKILEIDHELSDRSRKGLAWSYKKYKAYHAAIQLMDQLTKQGKWPLPRKPSQTELVEIFVSKSFWHSYVNKNFSRIASYPQMVSWLEREDGGDPSDFDIWHLQKSEYGFKELATWIANGGTLDKVAKSKWEKAIVKKGKAKGKAKAKGKGKMKAEERMVIDEEEEEEQEEEQEEEEEKIKGSGSNTKSHKRK